MLNKLVNYLLLKPKFGKWQTYIRTKKSASSTDRKVCRRRTMTYHELLADIAKSSQLYIYIYIYIYIDIYHANLIHIFLSIIYHTTVPKKFSGVRFHKCKKYLK
jgi:hypothetical protein